METKIRSNTGRQTELDIARGSAVIFMILIHTTEFLWNEDSFIYGKVANFLGSPPAAPVFMFLLGCGIMYSKHNSASELAKRGFKLLGLSYLFNILVYFLPYGIKYIIDRDLDDLISHLSMIYTIDILQFASLAFLFSAFVRFIKMKPRQSVITAFIISVIGDVLSKTIPEVEDPVGQAVSGLFWGTHNESYFPFTSWIIFAAAGYFFADHLQQTEDKKKFYLRLSPISGVVFIVMAAVLANFRDWDAMMDGPVYYHQDIILNLMFIAFVIAWLGICNAVASVLPEFPTNVMKRCSSNVTVIYVIQYVLIFAEVIITDESVFSAPIVFAIAVANTFASYYIAKLYKKLTVKK